MGSGARSKRTVLLAVLIIALFARIVAVGVLKGNEPIPGNDDQTSYDEYAKRIVEGHWLTEPVSYREVGYPFYLSIVYRIAGHSYLAGRIGNAIIGALACVLIFLLAGRIFGTAEAYLAGLWSIFYFHFIFYTLFILRETLIVLLMALMLLLLLEAIREKGRRYTVLSSLIYVLLIHTDARYLFYAPFLAAYFWIASGSHRAALSRNAWFFLIFLIAMIPWQYRNYRTYHTFVLVNTRTFVWSASQSQAPRVSLPADSLEKIDDAEKQAAVRELRGFRRKLYDFTEFFRVVRFRGEIRAGSTRYEKPWSLLHNISSLVTYGSLIPFFLFGYFTILRRRMLEAYLLLLPLVAHTILHLIKWGRTRYRVPIEPVLIIVACYGFLELWRRYRNRSLRGGEGPA